jgi:hypothetical protein
LQKATLAGIVSTFGAEAKAKLDNPAISGAPEDQLREPLERLFQGLAALDALAPGGLSLVGETTLSHLQTRPDYAVSVNNALVGFIEIKAPGKGCDPRKFSDPHDKAQWGKLKSLPNLIYTDGNGFSLWQKVSSPKRLSHWLATSNNRARSSSRRRRCERSSRPS